MHERGTSGISSPPSRSPPFANHGQLRTNSSLSVKPPISVIEKDLHINRFHSLVTQQALCQSTIAAGPGAILLRGPRLVYGQSYLAGLRRGRDRLDAAKGRVAAIVEGADAVVVGGRRGGRRVGV